MGVGGGFPTAFGAYCRDQQTLAIEFCVAHGLRKYFRFLDDGKKNPKESIFEGGENCIKFKVA